jgi:hypothetical protein
MRKPFRKGPQNSEGNIKTRFIWMACSVENNKKVVVLSSKLRISLSESGLVAN